MPKLKLDNISLSLLGRWPSNSFAVTYDFSWFFLPSSLCVYSSLLERRDINTHLYLFVARNDAEAVANSGRRPSPLLCPCRLFLRRAHCSGRHGYGGGRHSVEGGRRGIKGGRRGDGGGDHEQKRRVQQDSRLTYRACQLCQVLVLKQTKCQIRALLFAATLVRDANIPTAKPTQRRKNKLEKQFKPP